MIKSPRPLVHAFFDADTCTFTYVLYVEDGGACAILDSVLNFEPKGSRTGTQSADTVIEFVRAHDLQVEWILETHAHADHLSAAPYLQARLGGVIAIGSGILAVQSTFQKVFHLPSELRLDGSQFGRLFEPDEVFCMGPIQVRAMHVPGHTPADVAYVIEADDGMPLIAFVGDTLFMPDVGSARCDFPGGSARALYHSARRILALPTATRLFMCHDYPPEGREPRAETTVGEQRHTNIHLRDGVSEDQFVELRQRRDATLGMPALILPAIQVNIRGGQLPPMEANGVRYLKIPINGL
jgi:glyoxylase-like metal-dependent hydrolase (beta-lactamase superfamily II)